MRGAVRVKGTVVAATVTECLPRARHNRSSFTYILTGQKMGPQWTHGDIQGGSVASSMPCGWQVAEPGLESS